MKAENNPTTGGMTIQLTEIEVQTVICALSEQASFWECEVSEGMVELMEEIGREGKMKFLDLDKESDMAIFDLIVNDEVDIHRCQFEGEETKCPMFELADDPRNDRDCSKQKWEGFKSFCELLPKRQPMMRYMKGERSPPSLDLGISRYGSDGVTLPIDR